MRGLNDIDAKFNPHSRTLLNRLQTLDLADRFLETSVWLFGPVQIRTDGLISSHFRSNRVSALLAYLVLHPTGNVSREELSDQLWPNLDPQAARNNLRFTLQHLKKSLDVHGLAAAVSTTERNRLSLDRTLVRTDVDLLRDLIAAIRSEENDESRLMLLKRAAAVAKGPLVQDLYDDWITPHRAEAAEQRVWVLCKLSRLLLASDPQTALQVARKAITESPYMEEPRELSASALLALGDTATAIAELRNFEQVMKEQLGDKPSSRLKAFQTRLQSEPHEEERSSRLIGTIPYGLTRFFGRSPEMAHLATWFEDPEQRLLTLYGPGGVGKTRLAAEAASAAMPQWRVVWVDAQNSSSREALLEQLGRTLSPHHPISGDVLGHLAVTLVNHPTVLVMDNIEQVPDRDLLVLSDLLLATPKLKMLATSRKTLGLQGEHLLRIDPLPAASEASPAYQLFVDRARASRPDFEAGPGNTERLQRLCAKLEGIPLAIELAAARLTALDLDELIEGMNSRLDMLVAKRSADRRHQTLRATLEWSFALLDDEWRADVLSLATLRGAWSKEMAMAVCGGGHPPARMSMMLEVACDHSLLTSVSTASGTRYRMLEIMRDFAVEQVSDERREELGQRLVAVCKGIASTVPGGAEMSVAWPNLEAAMEFCIQRGDLPSFLDIAEPMLPVLMETSAGGTVLRLLDSCSATETALVSRRMYVRAALLLSLSRYSDSADAASAGLHALQAGSPLESALLAIRSRAKVVMGELEGAYRDALLGLECSRKQGSVFQADALLATAKVLYARHDDQAGSYAQEALELSRDLGDYSRQTDALDTLGCIQSRDGNLLEAERSFGQLADTEDESVPVTRRARVWTRLAQVALKRRNLDLARERYEAALKLARRGEDHWTIAQTLAQLGDTYQLLGEFELARSVNEEAVAMRRLTGERLGLATSLRGYGRTLLMLGERDKALGALREAAALGRQVADVRFLVTVLLIEAQALSDLSRKPEAIAIAREAIYELDTKGLTLESLDAPDVGKDIEAVRQILESH